MIIITNIIIAVIIIIIVKYVILYINIKNFSLNAFN